MSEEYFTGYTGEADIAALNAKIRANASKPAPVAHVPSDAEIRRGVELEAVRLVRDRAKPVFAEYGRPVPHRNDSEDILSFRKRLVRELQPETVTYADRDVRSVPADLFSPIEQQIYREAAANRWHPSDLKPNEMREVVKLDDAGRKVSEFVTGKGTGFPHGTSVFKQVYGHCIAPAAQSAIYKDGFAQQIGLLYSV
jgi:hypothetical protein